MLLQTVKLSAWCGGRDERWQNQTKVSAVMRWHSIKTRHFVYRDSR